MPLTRAMLKRRQELSPPVAEDENDEESSENDEGPHLGPKNHPLLNDLILSNLFEYMDHEALKACRLVCKKWNILTIPVARSRFKIQIYGHRSNPIIQDCPVQGIRTIEDFMELIRSNTLGIQFANFVLGPIDPTVDVGQEFLSVFGNGMNSWDLEVPCGDHMVEDIRVILQSTPNLEYIRMPRRICSKQGSESVVKLFPPKLPFLKTFDTRMEEPECRRKNCPTFLEELFTAAENISNVYFYNYDDPLNRKPSIILEVLQVFENLGRMSTLENLLISRVHRAHLIALKRMASNGLKLKHLRIVDGQVPSRMVLPDPETGNEWLEIIELFTETLITLDVSYRYTTSRLTELPRMPQLKNLSLQIQAGGDLRCERINFINTFPTLESLSITCVEGRYHIPLYGPFALHEFFSGTGICPNMKTLSLRDNLDLTKNQTLEYALEIFPNLCELELKVESAELLQPIWVHMSGLEKLHLYGILGNENRNIDLDSLFTGITSENIEKMGNPKKYFESLHLMSREKRKQTLQTLVQRHRTLPSISNLTNLRLLSLSIPENWCKVLWKSKYMTDLTGYLGLHFLENLQELRVWNCAFSKSCTKILIEDIGLQSYIFKQSEQEEIKDYVWSNKKPYNGIHPRWG